MRKFKDVNELVNTLKPDNPVYCIRPDSIRVSTEFFKKSFPGKVLVIEYESNIFTSKTSIDMSLAEAETNKQKIVIYLNILKFDIVI